MTRSAPRGQAPGGARGPIVLMTDFGDGCFQGVMKGVILSRAPDCRIVDLDHHVRAGAATKRGGEAAAVRLDSGVLTPEAAHAVPLDLDMLALDDALARLKAFGPRHSELVELRFFAGLSIAEAATVLKVSPATAKRDWVLARAWLYRELGRGRG